MYSETSARANQGNDGASLQFANPFRMMASDLLKPRGIGPRRSPVRRREGPLIPEESGWMRTLPQNLREDVARAMVVRDLREGQVLLRVQEEVQGWYGVLSGFLALEHPAPADAALNSGLVKRAWFGEHLLLGRCCSDCDVVARVPTRIACLPRAVFEDLVRQEPAFGQFVLKLQAQRLLATHNRLGWPRRLGTNARVACRIAELFLSGILYEGEHHLELTQSALSDFLDLSRQRTNAALNYLRRVGEIELEYGGLLVNEPRRLIQRAIEGEIHG